MTQAQAEILYDQWLRKGKFTLDGVLYEVGVNNHAALMTMTPDDLKMRGKICHLPSELTLTNADLDEDFHEGFTIGSGKTLYWMMTWHQSGHVTVYSKDEVAPRWISGDTIVTVHFKPKTNTR